MQNRNKADVATRAPIILITGVMAAGKSTVAELIAQQMDRCVHLRGDLFRKMVVSGRVDMSAEPSPEALRQLLLRYRAAAETAKLYSSSGFNVVYQDVVIGPVLTDVVSLFEEYPLHVVVLCPDAATVAQRELARAKTGYSKVSIKQLQESLESTPRIGLWIDSSNQSAAQTVDAIFAGLDLARL